LIRFERRQEAGYTSIELMIVVILLTVLVSIVVPQYFNSVRAGRFFKCRTNREAVVSAVISHIEKQNTLVGETVPSVPLLVRYRLLSVEPVCPAGGVYFWLDPTVPVGGAPRLGCSIHWVPE
jgi:competence protein ComGC